MPWPTTGRRPCYMRPTYHVSSWLAVLPRTAIRIFLLGCPGDSADSRPAVTAVAATSGSHLPTPFARKSTVQLLGWKDVFCCYRLWAGRPTPTSIFRTENTRFSTKFKVTHCPVGVINKPTTVELWISPVYRRLAVAKFSQSTM